MEDFLKGKKHIHFIGIGGSGMYPLAQILHSKGYYLTGSDNNETETLKAVRSMGIKVYMGQRAENIEGADLIIYTAAIMSDNPELIAARESGALTLERCELLGLVTSKYDKAVCVSGTHGKTTTSSMLTHIFLAQGIDLSAVIGGKLRAIAGSGRAGSSDVMVCEACEFSNTFLHLFPNISVILNIDADHLDYFKTMDNLKASFTKFCDRTTDILVINGDDDNTVEAVNASSFDKEIITFGETSKNRYYPENIERITDFRTDFDLMENGRKLDRISIHVPGTHNVLNAVAACAAAIAAGAEIASLNKGLETFFGAGRRFERLCDIRGITVVDDYAHHPAEIAATLTTAKAMTDFKRVWAVHQPFTYSRTATLMDDFADALSIADRVVLTEIMGSREKNTYNVYSADLAAKIDGCKWFPTFEEVAQFVANNAESGDMIITLGCGDVYKVAYRITELLKEKYE